ncbi:protein PIGBOS1 [Tiliqua scincoides]|uniref:protein PIGBOS1 n=1 Tax=Tiliqua scincoides TaxID=71010 RepID=UPI0034630082
MRRRLTFPQILLGTLLGVVGGVYIYKPIFEQHHWQQNKSSEKLQVAQEKEEKDSGV